MEQKQHDHDAIQRRVASSHERLQAVDAAIARADRAANSTVQVEAHETEGYRTALRALAQEIREIKKCLGLVP